MQTVTVKDPIRLYSGKIGLTDVQAKKRSRYLKHLAGNIYEIGGMIEFKAGEIIGFDEIPKGLSGSLIQPEAKAKTKAEAKAKAAVETPEAKPVLDQPSEKQAAERDFNDPDPAEVIKTKKRG